MQPDSSPPPFGRPVAPHVVGPAPDGAQAADRNEFADAVARMFEHRQQSAPEFSPPLGDDIPIRDDADEFETPRVSLLGSLIGTSGVRRALSIVPLAILGYMIAWFFYFEPSQNVTAKSAVELKQEVTQAATSIELPRPEAAEGKPAPMPTPAPAPDVTPVAPAPAPAVAVAAPSRPLSKDEVKELQGKLGAAGFTVGPIDGVVGPQTQAALRRYAQSRNLAKPDATQETLLRLRSETQASQ